MGGRTSTCTALVSYNFYHFDEFASHATARPGVLQNWLFQTKTYDKMTYLSRFIFVYVALDEKWWNLEAFSESIFLKNCEYPSFWSYTSVTGIHFFTVKEIITNIPFDDKYVSLKNFWRELWLYSELFWKR